MKNINIPDDQDVPSTQQLIKSTFMAVAAAGFILVTIVMPAEYGIDPTGFGETIGLKKMGEIKVSLAEEAATDRLQSAVAKPEASPAIAKPQVVSVAAKIVVPKPVPVSSPAILNHQMQITLAPNEGAEIKVGLSKGKKVQYKWWTDQGKANFDVHGDSQKLKINYHNYSKGSEQTKEGEIEAAFDGSHGWFWRNRTSQIITVTLQTTGEYTDIKHMK
ncbi:MAG: transmembrane anchor protein [Rhodospirillaceae bacterium]|nr:MAG: transmembrane anchor protein [Rhodospirillaceae bacterium]